MEPLNTQEDFGINLWGQPSSVCQEGGNLVPGLWAGLCALPNTNSKHGEEMESDCLHLYTACFAFGSSGQLFCDHICLPLPQL